MKLIHTSDWHLGQDFYHHSRAAEYDHFFEQLAAIIREEQPDALLVAGDVYHTAAPANEAVRQFTEQMLRLSAACPRMQTIIIGGNHDSQSRLDSTGGLWRLAGVTVLGALQQDDNAHIVRLPGIGYVCAIPHYYPRKDETVSAFERVGELVAAENTDHLPVVCMGHLYVSGCDINGHQLDNIGGMFAESVRVFGEHYDYVALGHIHRPQTLEGGRVRYAGSPLHVSMDENYPHTVSIVEIDQHGAMPRIEERRIHQLWHMYNIPRSGSLPYEDVVRELQDFNPAEPGYIMPRVCVETYLPHHAQAEIEAIVASKPNLRFTDWGITIRRQKQQGEHTHLSTGEVQQISPLEMARLYYRETYQEDLPQDYEQKLGEVIRQLEEEHKI